MTRLERLNRQIASEHGEAYVVVQGSDGGYYLTMYFGPAEIPTFKLRSLTMREIDRYILAKNESYEMIFPTCPRVVAAVKRAAAGRSKPETAIRTIKSRGTIPLRQAHIQALADLALVRGRRG